MVTAVVVVDGLTPHTPKSHSMEWGFFSAQVIHGVSDGIPGAMHQASFKQNPDAGKQLTNHKKQATVLFNFGGTTRRT